MNPLRGVPPPAVMLCWLCLCVPVCLAAEYLHPPGGVWGLLGGPRTSGRSIAALPGGYIVAGYETPVLTPEGGCADICSWATLTRLELDGSIASATNFHWVGWENRAYDVRPVLSGGGALTGLVFAGFKYYHAEEDGHFWTLPWVWLVGTDATLTPQWDAHVGTVGQWGVAYALSGHPAGWVAGGLDGYPIAEDAWGWLGEFGAGGGLVSTPLPPYAFGRINAIEPAGDGGFVLGTDEGLVKLDASLGVEWQAGAEPAGAGYGPDAYHAVKRTPAGDFVAVGRRPMTAVGAESSGLAAADGSVGAPPYLDPADWTGNDLVLTKLTAGGDMVWSRVYGDGGTAVEVGNDLVVAADGSIVVVGTIDSSGHGGADLWVLKTDANGEMTTANEWDVCLGGAGNDYGYAITIAPDDGLPISPPAPIRLPSPSSTLTAWSGRRPTRWESPG